MIKVLLALLASWDQERNLIILEHIVRIIKVMKTYPPKEKTPDFVNILLGSPNLEDPELFASAMEVAIADILVSELASNFKVWGLIFYP